MRGCHTEQRVGLTKGNPKELEQWANVFIFDIYTMVAELQQDDPKNLYRAAYRRSRRRSSWPSATRSPSFPAPAFNGLTDLGRDIITPFMTRMTNAGNRPILKIYPDTGHFIHTDNPVEFAADVVDFVSTGNGRHQLAARDRSHDQRGRRIGDCRWRRRRPVRHRRPA